MKLFNKPSSQKFKNFDVENSQVKSISQVFKENSQISKENSQVFKNFMKNKENCQEILSYVLCKFTYLSKMSKTLPSFADKNLISCKMIDDDILNLIRRIIDLIQINIDIARQRLASMDLDLNKYMKMYNGNRRIKILYQNIQGTLSKQNIILTITSILTRLDPDILAIAEPESNDLDIDWHPYKLIKGYIHKGTKTRLNVLVKSDLNFSQHHWNVEIPHAIIKTEGWNFIFAYREWAKCGDQSTKDMQHQLKRWETFVGRWKRERGKKTMMMGDMNFHYWGSEGSQKQLRFVRDMVHDNIISDGWFQLVTGETRYQKNCVPTCLDHIYSRTTTDVEYIKNFNETGYDHNCIGVHINVSNKILHPQVTEYRDIKGIALGDFVDIFSNLDLAGIYTSQDANHAVELLTHNINVVLNKLAPIKRRIFKLKTSAHWLSRDLRERIKERNLMRRRAVENGEWDEFRRVRNRLKSDMMRAKKDWIRMQVSRENLDPKARWRAMKSATQGKRNENQITLNTQNGAIFHPEAVARHLNEYYVSKVENITTSSPPDPVKSLQYTKEYMAIKKGHPEFEFQCVSPAEVSRIIKGLKMTGAVGHDSISTQVIKNFEQVLTPYIAKVVNLAIMTSTYPQTWKYGIISPVPKGGDLTMDRNWRPVTLLPIMSKILETVLNGQLKSYMELHRILPSSQHAYRAHKSTDTAWADLDARIQKATDTGKYVGLLLVDMSAAFNLVAKEIIVPKLKEFGVGHYAAKLIHSYLSSRKSRVKVRGAYSAWIAVKTGIGEGSVLGPLVFILTIVCCSIVLYRTIDKLHQMSITAKLDNSTTYEAEVNLSSIEFADDVTGVTVCDTEDQVEKSLQIMAKEYAEYFSANGLKINVLKSEHIIFGHPRKKQIFIDGRCEAEHVKLLGLTVSKHYKFDAHVDKITEKMAKRNGQISNLVGIAGKDTLKMLAVATVQSVAMYGASVYVKDKATINRIQVKLNSTLRMVTGSRRKTHVADMLKDLDWMKFELMVAHSKVMLLHRIVSFAAAPFCMSLVTAASQQTRYAVRERELRIAWRPKLARRGYNSFLVTAVRLYNQTKILGKIMKTTSLSKFVKSQIKQWRSV